MHIKEVQIMSLFMPIENSLWHARIGIINLNNCIKKIKVPTLPLINCHFSVLFFKFFLLLKYFFRLKLPKLLLLICYILVVYIFNLNHLLLLQSGDIEINPGAKKSSGMNFCHWNLNGIATHDSFKLTLIEAFIKANDIDIICLSETVLDSTIPFNDERLYFRDYIKGYSMIRADHPSNTK